MRVNAPFLGRSRQSFWQTAPYNSMYGGNFGRNRARKCALTLHSYRIQINEQSIPIATGALYIRTEFEDI